MAEIIIAPAGNTEQYRTSYVLPRRGNTIHAYFFYKAFAPTEQLNHKRDGVAYKISLELEVWSLE
jgi:hypothetical protein